MIRWAPYDMYACEAVASRASFDIHRKAITCTKR